MDLQRSEILIMENKNASLLIIDELFEQASNLAIALIEIEARKILAADPDLHEYIMAMGSGFFTAKEGGKYDLHSYTDEQADKLFDEDFPFADKGLIMDTDHTQGIGCQPGVFMFKEFFNMVDGLNERFNVCGCPMRFTATSEVVSHWGDTRKNPVIYKEKLKS
jgi:hypothetical protein